MHADHAFGPAVHLYRHTQVRPGLLADATGTHRLGLAVQVAIEQQRLPGVDDPAGEPLAAPPRSADVAVPIRKVDHVRGPIEQSDVRDVGLEQRPDLVADKFDQSRQIELARELPRNRVDRVQLGRALLRVGEQPGVLHRHRGGQ